MPRSPPQILTKQMQGKSSPVSLCGHGGSKCNVEGLKTLWIFFLPPYNHLQLSTCFRAIATEPSWFNFIRLPLPPPESPKPLFILGAGRALVLPHLLSSDIKVSQFTPPSLILPFSLPPMFCKFPCILPSNPVPLVFVSRFTFTREVLARRQRPSGSTFHSTACSCESPTAGQVNCLERKESTAGRGHKSE